MRCALLRQPTSGSSAVEQHPEVPLQSVSSQVYIHGHVASVHLHQNFLNDSDQPCDVAYRFPVPALAAVNTFVMHRGDGHKVTGTCKEKEEARKAFEAAMHEGKTSGFGGEQTKDCAF